MLVEVVSCTQFLGNVIDVAKMEGADLDDATHFPFTSPFGAQLVTDKASFSNGAKAFASTADVSMKLESVKEEDQEEFTVTMVAINARDAGFPRTPVPGDTFKTRPSGSGAAGGKLPRCRAYVLGANSQLELVAEFLHVLYLALALSFSLL